MAALLFIDSFDHYSTTQGPRKWTSWSGSITTGRTGNGAGISGDGPGVTLGAEYGTLCTGIAHKTPAYSNYILRHSNGPVSFSLSLSHMGDGRLRMTAAAGLDTGAGAPSTFVASLNLYYYYEMQSTVSIGALNIPDNTIPVTYTYNVYANEALILTGGFVINARANFFAGAPANGYAAFNLGGPGGGSTAIVDDCYCTDGELLGDVKIQVLYPNAAGSHTMWTPVPAGSNYNNVKEHPADDDTSYVSSAAVNDIDSYNLDDIGTFTGTIKGVQALWLNKKNDAGSGAIKGLWRSGATEVLQTHGRNFVTDGFHPAYSDYQYSIEAERKSLFTAADWTTAEVNALELGVKRTL